MSIFIYITPMYIDRVYAHAIPQLQEAHGSKLKPRLTSCVRIHAWWPIEKDTSRRLHSQGFEPKLGGSSSRVAEIV